MFLAILTGNGIYFSNELVFCVLYKMTVCDNFVYDHCHGTCSNCYYGHNISAVSWLIELSWQTEYLTSVQAR